MKFMSKKEKLQKAIAVSMMMTNIFCTPVWAAPVEGTPGANGAAIVQNDDISAGLNATYTADNGTAGGDAPAGGIGGAGGNGGSVTINDTVTGTIGGAIEITATGGDGAVGGIAKTDYTYDGPHGDSGAGGDSKVAVAVTGSGITTVNDITVTAKAGSGSTVYVYTINQSEGANGDEGGSAAAIGLQAAGSNTLVTITAADVTISAEGGNGGFGVSSYSNGGVGGMGGAAEAYGLKAATNSLDLAINDIQVTASGGKGGKGGNGGDNGNIGDGNAAGVGGKAAVWGIEAVNSDIGGIVNSISAAAVGGAGERGGASSSDGHRSRIELSHDMLSAEYKLAKKDQEREAILKTIPGGLARVDARDCETVLWYGGKFLEMLGYTEEQFIQELHSKCSYVHTDDRERAASLMRSISKTGEYTVAEFKFVTRSGEVRALTVTFCYVSGEDSWDGIPSIYSVGIDITEERREQERQRRALEDAYQSLHVANLAKSNFLSSMSHDIRTPMNAIIGMTAIARANLHEPEKVNGCLGKINVSSMHLLRLINEVLDMSKIESGKVDLVLEDVSLPDVVDNIVNICRPMMVEKQQEFKVNIFNVRNEHVITDGDRLQQVFMNLLSNAIKYTPEGGKISLTINELKSELPTKGNYEFIFTDNGIGMPDEYMQHVFEPFARAKDENISKIQGTGLGLAITQNIVQMMNGTIEVQSRHGAGSIFTVSVPLELQLKEEQEHKELSGLPVLVVDDELAVCESAAMLLQELGMRGSWVLSGAEAVERVVNAHERSDDFYAVILDWKMPDMDGLETVRVIRKRVGAKVPIIIISAYDYSNIEKEFIDAGADAFISKPLFKSKMLHVLQLFCDTCKDTCDGEAVPELHKELAGKRVLLVEDNELNREIAAELLGMQGLQVEAAENGKSAVELFVRSVPGYYDVVLMDIQMPVMDGYEATAAIRALPRQDAVRIPILALTANAFVTDAGKAKNAGMNDHITKPINLEVLFAALHKWLV